MSKLYSTMFNGPQTTPEQEEKFEKDSSVRKSDEEMKRKLENMSEEEKWELFKKMTLGK